MLGIAEESSTAEEDADHAWWAPGEADDPQWHEDGDYQWFCVLRHGDDEGSGPQLLNSMGSVAKAASPERIRVLFDTCASGTVASPDVP